MRIRLALYRGLALGLAILMIATTPGEAWAKPKTGKAPAAKAKGKKVAPAPNPPARSLGEPELIAGEAATLRATLAAAPNDEPTGQGLAQLALRSARGAEHAIARGDEKLFHAYRQLIEEHFLDQRERLTRMAGRGVGAADFALGVLALHGILGERSVEQACTRFGAALEKGYAGAKFRHAQCIEERAPARTAELMREAADAGHAGAMEQLGRQCLDASPPDASCARSWLERAAKEGRASAKTLLGWMHVEGIGGKQDFARAAQLYRDAASQGEPSARNNLGELLENGRGVRRDERSAFEQYRQAAEAGFAPAQFNLGRLYAAGRGVGKNIGESRRWLTAAANAGIANAQPILQLLENQNAH